MIHDAEGGESAHGELEAEDHHDEGGESARPCAGLRPASQPFDGEQAGNSGNAEYKHVNCAKPRRFGSNGGDEGCENKPAGEEPPQ